MSPTPTWSWENWLLKNSQSGSAALDLHVHDVDTIQWFFGAPAVVTSVGRAEADGGYGQIVTSYGYDDGPMVVAEGNWNFPPDFPFSKSALVTFEKAAVDFDSLSSPTLTVYLAEGGKENPDLSGMTGYTEEIRYFVNCVATGGVADHIPLSESAKTVAIVEAEVESAQAGGKAVKIK